MFSDSDQDNDGEVENDLPPIDADDLSVPQAPQPPLPQVPQQPSPVQSQPPPPVQRQPLPGPNVDMIQMMQMAGGPANGWRSSLINRFISFVYL